jgi:hypothetical protein
VVACGLELEETYKGVRKRRKRRRRKGEKGEKGEKEINRGEKEGEEKEEHTNSEGLTVLGAIIVMRGLPTITH